MLYLRFGEVLYISITYQIKEETFDFNLTLVTMLQS